MNTQTVSEKTPSKRPVSSAETKFSFAIALATLLLVMVYFVQSFIHIRDQEVLVIAIDRLQESLVESGTED